MNFAPTTQRSGWLSARGWGLGAIALTALLLVPEVALAGRGRSSTPSDTQGPPVRVERSRPSSPSSSAPRTRSSSPPRTSTPSSSPSSPGGTASQGRTRPRTPARQGDAPTRIEHRRPGGGYGGGHHGYGYYYPSYGHHYVGYYGPYWWFWPGHYLYDYGYYGYGRGYGYGPPRPYYQDNYRGDLGALDLDVKPEKAEVYIDGQYIGVADDFDGFPSYLWLEEGIYDVVFHRQGYETVARRYRILPGLTIDVEDSLRAGETLSPEESLAALVQAQGPAPREERISRSRSDRRYEEWDRDEARPGEVRSRRVISKEGRDSAQMDARGEPGRLALALSPADASVYLDGRFLGTAGELAKLSSGLIVDPGEHTLEVVRPGYESDSTEFEVEAGEEVTIEVELEVLSNRR